MAIGASAVTQTRSGKWLSARYNDRWKELNAVGNSSAQSIVNMTIPAEQRTAQSFEYLLQSYKGNDGLLRSFKRNQVTGDQILKAYSIVRESYMNGRAMDFERALASTNLGAGYADGTAMNTLNLDTTMTSVLYDNQHLVMWNWTNRVPSINPIYQWTEREQYGSVRGGFGFAQGGVPVTGLASWDRQTAQVCFFGVRRGITDVEAQSGLLGGVMVDPVQEEDRDGALQLLGRAETNLMWGDSAVTDDSGNTVNYPGFFQQMTDTTGSYSYGIAPLGTNVLDLQGRWLDFTDLNNIAAILFQQGKLSSFANLRMFMTPSTLQDLSNLRSYTDRRLLVPDVPEGKAGPGYVTGTPIPGHATNFGFIPFTASIFLNEVPNGQPINSGLPEEGSPAVPTISVSAEDPPSGYTSYFVAANGLDQSDAGTYYYWASAVNDEGESFPSGATTNSSGEITGATPQSCAVAVGQVVAVVITPGTANGAKTTQYRVYRGVTDSISDLTTTIIGHMAVNPNNLPSTSTYIDTNWQRSGTSVAMILERSPSNLAIAQMAPMTKYPLAIISTKVEWLLLLYHVAVIKARARAYIIRNVGPFQVNL